MSVFDGGDRIGFINNGKTKYGLIKGLRYNSVVGEDEYIVKWDDGVTETYACSSVDKSWFRINDISIDMFGNPPPDANNIVRKATIPPELWKHIQIRHPAPSEMKMIDIKVVIDEHGNNVCNHKFVPYYGLIDSFEYCIHCDEKKRN